MVLPLSEPCPCCFVMSRPMLCFIIAWELYRLVVWRGHGRRQQLQSLCSSSSRETVGGNEADCGSSSLPRFLLLVAIGSAFYCQVYEKLLALLCRDSFPPPDSNHLFQSETNNYVGLGTTKGRRRCQVNRLV